MKKLTYLAVLGALAMSTAGAHAQAAAQKGKMLYGADGGRLGSIYRVTQDGSAQIIIDGKLVTIPGSTIKVDGDKIATSLSKNEVISLK